VRVGFLRVPSRAVPLGCRRAGYFLFRQKVAKNHCASHTGFGNIVLPKLPYASCAERAGANSHIPVLGHSRLAPAWRCDARRRATAPNYASMPGHPWPAARQVPAAQTMGGLPPRGRVHETDFRLNFLLPDTRCEA
jgi:hypothetical protein